MSERLLRNTLFFTFFYNLMGFATFMFPARFGGMAALPTDVPFLYSAFIATNILLFAFVGLWQARATRLHTPLLVIFGVSKIVFFGLMTAAWSLGEVALAGVAMSAVDLAMGVIFLLGAKRFAA